MYCTGGLSKYSGQQFAVLPRKCGGIRHIVAKIDHRDDGMHALYNAAVLKIPASHLICPNLEDPLNSYIHHELFYQPGTSRTSIFM